MAYFNNLTVGGTAKFLQDIKWPGLKSTVDELNYLHTEIIAKDGWYFPDKGEFILDGMPGATGPLGLAIGNTYTFTLTFADGTVDTDTAVAIDGSTTDSMWPVGTPMLQGSNYEGIQIVDKVSIDADWNVTAGNNYYWGPIAGIDDNLVSVVMTGNKSDGTAFTTNFYEYGKVPYENLELIPVVEQYYEWTSSDVIPVKGQVIVTGELVTFMRPSPLYNRCEIISRWKEINRSDVFDEYVSPSGLMAAPFDANGEYATAEGVYITGNASDSVYLGTGEETTTTAYNEWYITEQYTVLFDEKGMFIRQTSMAAPDEEGTTETITETEDHPSYAIRSYAYGVDRNSDINPFTDASITWGFLTSVRKTRGSYIQLRWYQD